MGERSASFKDALTSICTQLAGVAVGSNPAVTFKVLAANWMQVAFLRVSVEGTKVGSLARESGHEITVTGGGLRRGPPVMGRYAAFTLSPCNVTPTLTLLLAIFHSVCV